MILVVLAFSRELAVAKENCTHQDTMKLAASLKPGRSLRAVATELDSARAHYMVFAGDQKISPDATERREVNSLLPISILVVARCRFGLGVVVANQTRQGG
jgi:hypothetical protein